jgi:hypothetical protein
MNLGKLIVQKVREVLVDDRLIKKTPEMLQSLSEDISVLFNSIESWKAFFGTNN